ncbi:Maf family nucleotide pyrophosphatase [Leeuwenhoekiella nanhaiensis]|uniref:dTTP/UTP pyrophosphatase n=1 Tax=Leeuwenhoekiella nanhaiensis TaxID=1655491 RepID=A0A2G1VS16_9FLAO|nr:Maf family nucleotide pyrophosphatase [Leeuwenhoekiella nanhaiensis]PHQ29249.1 septum formation protein Maf [Leeuwenhoekiella nanhaiensis]
MLQHLLKSKKLILASQSPRRQELLAALEVNFEVRLKPVDESFPSGMQPGEIAEYIAQKKAAAFEADLQADEILITGDTLVFKNTEALGKPIDAAEARQMLQLLSGTSHEVISSVCVTTSTQQVVGHDKATVHFRTFTEAEISHYINTYKPFDKAGAYGIQEWIGHVALQKLEGSYNTVMGLPTHLLYDLLNKVVV